MYRVESLIAVGGFGGNWYIDRQAVRAGAVQDGLTFRGETVTPGFKSIVQPAAAICVQLILDDGSVAYGDCVGVAYSGQMTRDALLYPSDQIPIIEKYITPKVVGRELSAFRPLAEEIEGLVLDGKKLHANVRYGVSQALLDAVAKAKRVTMAEVIAQEYGTTLAHKPIPLNVQVGTEWYDPGTLAFVKRPIDKVILRRAENIHTGSIYTMDLFNKQLEYLAWVKERIQQIGDKDYHPTIHFDLYGHIGFAFNNDVPKMVSYFQKLEKTAKPYSLIIEDPVNMGDKARQIEVLAALRAGLKKAGVQIITMADELCTRLEDHKAFAEAGAVDMQKIKAPDLGSITNAIEGLLYLKTKGVEPYLGGSATETDRAAQVRVHIGLATQPNQMLASPGSGIDEAYCITMNEMLRTLALIGKGRNPGPAAAL